MARGTWGDQKRNSTGERWYEETPTRSERWKNVQHQWQDKEEAFERLQHDMPSSLETTVKSDTSVTFLLYDDDLISFEKHTTIINSTLMNKMGYKVMALTLMTKAFPIPLKWRNFLPMQDLVMLERRLENYPRKLLTNQKWMMKAHHNILVIVRITQEVLLIEETPGQIVQGRSKNFIGERTFVAISTKGGIRERHFANSINSSDQGITRKILWRKED